MQYSKKIINKEYFNYKMKYQNKPMPVKENLIKRLKSIEYDRNITKEEIEEAILFDQYICALFDESYHGTLSDCEIKSIKEYIIIFYNYLKDDEQKLHHKKMASINEFPIFCSHIEQLKNLFKNDSNIMNILDFIVEKKQKLIVEAINPIWEKYENGGMLTKHEKDLLARYFNANTPCQEKTINDRKQVFFKKELSRLFINPNDISLRMLEFISKCAVFNNLAVQNSNINLNDYYFIYCYDLKKDDAYAYNSDNKFAFGYRKFKNDLDGVLWHIMAMYHEARHALQYYLIKSDKLHHKFSSLSVSMQLVNIFSEYLDYGDKDEYHTNYHQQEIEHDANRNAYFHVKRLLGELNIPEDLKKHLTNKADQEWENKKKELQMTFRLDEQGIKYISSTFKIKKLDHLVKNKPKLLNIYGAILRLLYDSKGNPKNPVELLGMFEFSLLNQYNDNLGFIREYFLYRNEIDKEERIFDEVLTETDVNKRKLKLNNMFQLLRAARNELHAYNYNFNEYFSIKGYKENDILQVINRNSIKLIKLIEAIYPVLVNGHYEKIEPEFEKNYINQNKLQQYQSVYQEIQTKITNYKNFPNRTTKPRR